MLYYVPFPGYWLYECSTCHAKVTRGSRDEIQTARSNHDVAHACGEIADMGIAWVASEEVSGLQGSMLLPGDVLQEGLPL